MKTVSDLLHELSGKYHEFEVNYRPQGKKGSDGLIYLFSSYTDDSYDYRIDTDPNSLEVASYELMDQDRYIEEIQDGKYYGDETIANTFGYDDNVFRFLVIWISEDAFEHVHAKG